MMVFEYHIVSILLAYLIGSIPTSVWVGKAIFGVDVREEGSRNPGASNTFRVLGKKAGIPVLLIDVLKGWFAASLLTFNPNIVYSSEEMIIWKIILGVIAVLGHIFPLYIRFKGGKGIATLFGMVLAIHWPAALTCSLIFILLLYLTRYVSLSSIIATCAFPILIVYVFKNQDQPLLIFGVCVSLLVLITHHKNIGRLFRGEENKANLRKKKSH